MKIFVAIIWSYFHVFCMKANSNPPRHYRSLARTMNGLILAKEQKRLDHDHEATETPQSCKEEMISSPPCGENGKQISCLKGHTEKEAVQAWFHQQQIQQA